MVQARRPLCVFIIHERQATHTIFIKTRLKIGEFMFDTHVHIYNNRYHRNRFFMPVGYNAFYYEPSFFGYWGCYRPIYMPSMLINDGKYVGEKFNPDDPHFKKYNDLFVQNEEHKKNTMLGFVSTMVCTGLFASCYQQVTNPIFFHLSFIAMVTSGVYTFATFAATEATDNKLKNAENGNEEIVYKMKPTSKVFAESLEVGIVVWDIFKYALQSSAEHSNRENTRNNSRG